MSDSSNEEKQADENNIGRGMLYLAWITAFILLTAFATHWTKKRENPNSMPEASSANGVNQVILIRNHQHHYVTTGDINGTTVEFLLDTGATHVSVPKHIADELNLEKGWQGQAITANGTVDVISTIIDNLQIGTIHLSNVRASINPGMEQDQILLGMSALKSIEFTHRDGTLTLKQYY